MQLVKLLAVIMIVSTMLAGGLQVNWQRVRAMLREYELIGRALLANFVLVPLFAFLLVRLFHVDGDVSAGILLMAMAPGVPFLLNAAGRKQGGSHSFALLIAFVFSAISVVTIPLTAQFLLPPDFLAHVPAQKFLTTLVGFQLLPLLAGALIASRAPEALIERLIKLFHLAFLGGALVLIVLIFPKLVSSVSAVYGSGHLVIIAAIGLFSVAAGWLLGGPEGEYRRTLSVATILRNIGLCVLIATADFPDTLVAPTVIAYFAINFVLSLPIRIYFQRTKKAAVAAA